MQHSSQIKVWDPLVRIFHWTLAASFIVAFATEDDLMDLHVWAGYLLLTVILIRVVWGFIGTEHARFTDFVTRPGTAWQYVKDTFSRRAKRYIGHNPAGGLMIVIMLVGLLLTGLSGIALYGVEEHAGPMASLFAGGSYAWLEDPLEGLHEFLANFMMLLVVIHVSGVLLESLIHRENLVRAMWNGYKNPENISHQ
jgi:cytochrome b